MNYKAVGKILDWLIDHKYTWEKSWLMGVSLYGRPCYADFVVFIENGIGMAVKVCFQDQAGSVDEKFPYWIANMQSWPMSSILIIDGPGTRQDALAWAKQETAKDGSSCAVMSITEFYNWLQSKRKEERWTIST